MSKVLRETAAALEYSPAPDSGVPWPWNVPDGEWTWEMYCRLPEGDGFRYEVIGGGLIVSPPPVEIHQRVLRNLLYEIESWVRKTKKGQVYSAPFDVILSFVAPEQHYVEPDLLFISGDRLSIITANNVQGAPDLVVEVLSPSTARRDWVDKRRVYEASGVANYWVVDPDKKVLTAFHLKEGKYELEGRFGDDTIFEPKGFSGLRINLAEVCG